MSSKIVPIFLKLSRASLITAVSSACAILELTVLSTRLAISELGIVLAAQATAALLSAVGEAGFSLWVPQRLSLYLSARRLTSLSRYSLTVRIPLFLVQAAMAAAAARYTMIGWENFGMLLMLSASMSFSFVWILIAAERYLLIAAIDGVTRIVGLLGFVALGSATASSALMFLAVSCLAQPVLQLIAARRSGLLYAIPGPVLRRPRLPAKHLAAYQSAVVNAIGRNILPVTVGAIVAAPIASAALSAEKVSRAATGVVTAGLGYILPALGRSYRDASAARLYAIAGLTGAAVLSATASGLFAYGQLSNAPLAELFAGNMVLLLSAAALTATKVVLSATIYARLLAKGAFRLTSQLLGAQAVAAAAFAVFLKLSDSVTLFMLGLSLFDICLIAAAVQFSQRSTQQ